MIRVAKPGHMDRDQITITAGRLERVTGWTCAELAPETRLVVCRVDGAIYRGRWRRAGRLDPEQLAELLSQ